MIDDRTPALVTLAMILAAILAVTVAVHGLRGAL